MSRNLWRVFYRPGDRHHRSQLLLHESRHWTCHEDTEEDDHALLYVKKPISALVGVLIAETDAEPEESEYTKHAYQCDVDVKCVFENPLTFREMRDDKELSERWGLIRGQFQPPGGIPPVISWGVMKLLCKRIPELRQFVD